MFSSLINKIKDLLNPTPIYKIVSATDTKPIGCRIKEARVGAGLTQKELSAILKISPPHLSRYESGEASLPLKRLLFISTILKLDIVTVLEERNSRYGIGDRIKKARIASGLTQKQLGYHIHKQPNVISRYELSKHQPRQDTMIKLAGVLGVSMDYLQHGIE